MRCLIGMSCLPVSLLAAGFALVPSAAMAQDATELDEVTVTATRTPVGASAALAPTELIDRDAIERSGARSLPQLLRGRAGVQLVNQGGIGKLTTLSLRGTESDHTLVLVDGVRIGSTTAGFAALQDLPLEHIERIEIVRGPRSSLYGADAIGGVIHVFTRPARAGVRSRAHAGVGSHGLREAGAGVDVGQERAWFGADAAWQRDSGIDACEVARPTPFSGGCFIAAPQPDRDGYRNASLALRGGVRPSDAFQADARILRANSRNWFDGDYVDRSDNVQQIVSGNARWTPHEALRVTLAAGRNLDDSESFLGDALQSHFRSTRDSASLQSDIAAGKHATLTLGADWLRDHALVVDAFSPFVALRHSRGLFAQYQGGIAQHSLQAALRHDRDGQFGGHTTGNAAWGLQLPHDLRLSAGVGTAFKAPTFNELYYPFFGNPRLKPETSRSVELGMAQTRDAWHWRIDTYHTRIRDLIAFDAALNLPNNLDSARIRGAEASLGTTLAGWEFTAQTSYVDARNGDLRLPRRARLSGRVDGDKRVGDWRFGASLIGQGRRFDDVANTRALGGYATLDLRVDYALSPQWLLQAGLDNAFDKQFETASFYRQPGREWLLRLRYRGAGRSAAE